MQVRSIQITTSSGGAFVGTAVIKTPARLVAVEWVKGTLVNGVDVTLICTEFTPRTRVITLLTLTDANADALYYPKVTGADGVGAEIADAYESPLVHGTVKLTIAQGGDTKAGTLWLYLDE